MLLRTITLTTDFGLKDGNVGVMKGVIWGIAPRARIADLSHHIGPQNIREAALVLYRSAPYFPEGSIHVVVVDPGVGTERRSIAGQLGPHYFVGPDNGVIGMLWEWAEEQDFPVRFVNLDNPHYWLKEVSSVFHGRDIFAPTAGHLAAGVPLNDLGTPIDDSHRLSLPQPQPNEHGWLGEVIHIDHFGNISSSIRREHLGNRTPSVVSLCGVEIHDFVNTFGEREVGTLVALYGSTGSLIVSVVNGSAAQQLGAQIGDSIEVIVPTNDQIILP
jgi:S-adenosylmethionine hydrolase